MSSIRTYRAATVREALALVRAELGEDALLLGRREVRRRRFPWYRTTVEMEVTAAIGPGTERFAGGQRRGAASPADDVRLEGVHEQSLAFGRAADAAPDETFAAPSAAVSPSQPLWTAVPGPEHDWRTVRGGADPADPFAIYTHLIEQGVDLVDAREIVSRMEVRAGSRRPLERDLQQRLQAVISEVMPTSGALQVDARRRRVAALVGPTGVGKTTTIAKLAANFRLREGRRVGLITVDTYRVAAIDQLRTYAQLVDIPLRVVATPREMPQALDDLSGTDLVLIDTAGRSPQDDLRIQELRSFLQAAQADEVHLVLSLSSGLRNATLAAERFRRVGPTSVLLTKLDEAAGPGAVLSAARCTGLPVSYLTTGQDVPDDIETATAARLVQRLWPASVSGPRLDAAAPAGESAWAPFRGARDFAS